jgi:6-phosphofructokinase 1
LANIQRIGVLTGGGDCPGLNAVIRAVAKAAIYDHKWEVFGIEDGFLGLIQNRIHPLTADAVSGILTHGGTILGSSNKADPTRYPTGYNADGEPTFGNVTDRVVEHVKHHELDTVVVIGGDGTMSGARNLVEHGVNCIGLPKTIDNDLVGTDITFGFMTAVETATEALDRLHSTAQSHHRVLVVELMGRNAGWIALHSGVASGSDVIVIPEIPYSLEAICDFVRGRNRRGRRFSIVAVSEGAKPEGGQQSVARIDPTSPDPVRLGGIGQRLAEDIERCTGIETRAVTLGHVVRGGTPVAADRVLATTLGAKAVELIADKRENRLVVIKNMEAADIDIREAADQQRTVPPDNPLLKAARAVGTCMGDVNPR